MYLVFTGSSTYPRGGYNDFNRSGSDFQQLMIEIANMADIDWWQVVSVDQEDPTSFSIIAEGVRR
jgi:hypothetical protein